VIGIQTSACRPRSCCRVSRRSRPASSKTVRARSISRRFLLRLFCSRIRYVAGGDAEADEELDQQRDGIGLGVRFGPQHELARRTMESGLVDRRPAGHNVTPLGPVRPCARRAARSSPHAPASSSRSPAISSRSRRFSSSSIWLRAFSTPRLTAARPAVRPDQRTDRRIAAAQSRRAAAAPKPVGEPRLRADRPGLEGRRSVTRFGATAAGGPIRICP
jgi:hypothetical protein